jgi:HB1, ASXL, restriction endonuclease HTH domain
MNHYGNAVVEAEKEITQLEERIQNLRDFVANGRILAMNGDATPILVTEEFAKSRLPETVTRKGSRADKGSILSGSISDHIHRILRGAGQPLTSVEIIDRLKTMRKIRNKNPWSSIADALKRHPKIFKRVRPGVYGLRRGQS